MTQEEYWYWLCSARGIFSDAIGRLLAAYESPEEIYGRGYAGLCKDKVINKTLAWNLAGERKNESFRAELEKIKSKGIDFIWPESPLFPERLKNIPNRPYCLYARGKLPGENLPTCAIVGARACSEYGKRAAAMFSSYLAKEGIQIISGMAAGIDSAAQAAALESSGKTFAVLGGGADVIYPAENSELYWRIISDGGGIISEYPPGCAPLAWQFPHRNRIISGLSDKVLIIEARKRSGSLSTARHALDQGKDIYALPGRITDPLSEGCNGLIKDGAAILMEPEQVAADFFTESEAERAFCRERAASEADEEEAADETGLLKYLSYDAQRIEVIAAKARLNIEETAVKLAILELEGRAKEVGKDYYVRI